MVTEPLSRLSQSVDVLAQQQQADGRDGVSIYGAPDFRSPSAIIRIHVFGRSGLWLGRPCFRMAPSIEWVEAQAAITSPMLRAVL